MVLIVKILTGGISGGDVPDSLFLKVFKSRLDAFLETRFSQTYVTGIAIGVSR